MAKCPNCGQTTARTEDWACQWCGYPLTSNSYKKLPQTYKQLKEEKLEEEITPVTPVPDEEPEPEPEPVIELPPHPAPPLIPEPLSESEPEIAPEPEPEPVIELPPQPVPESPPEPAPELKPEPTPQPQAIREPEIEITVDELIAAYETDGSAADARFNNKVLKVMGLVDRIEVKEMFDVYYINLSSAERNIFQTVRCIFDKNHADALGQLSIGETVTVQGIYDGTIMDIRVKDCVLV